MRDTTVPSEQISFDCLKTIALDGTLQAMDPDGLCLMEIDDFSLVAGQQWSTLWPINSQSLVTSAVERAVNGKVARFSADCPTAKGVLKSWEVTVTPIRNGDGEIVALQSLSQDVTLREHDLRETALISRELSHRIKNLFTVVDSLVQLSARTEPGSRQFIDNLRERLMGLGRAIAYIYPEDSRDVWTTDQTVRGLMEVLLAPYRLGGADIHLDGEDTAIGERAGTSVAMVLNELATNAVKYGGLRDAGCRLDIHITKTARTTVVLWTESCTHHVTRSYKPGFGTALLDRAVRHQLAGTIERDWSENGLVVRLEFSTSRLAEG